MLYYCSVEAANTLRARPWRRSQTTASLLRDSIADCIASALRSASAFIAKRVGTGTAASLPAAVLCHIFSFLTLKERVAASQTCSSWRKGALAAEYLWTNVALGASPYTSYTPTAAVELPSPNWAAAVAILRRQGSLSGSAVVSCNVSDFASGGAAHQAAVAGMRAILGKSAVFHFAPFAVKMIAAYSYDWSTYYNPRDESYRLVCYPTQSMWVALTDGLRCPAPSLTSFSLRLPSAFDPDAGLPLDPNIFAAAAGRLRSCWLDQVILPSGGCPAFSNLTTFDYCPRQELITHVEILDILSWMPCLEMFGLSLVLDYFFRPSAPPGALHDRLSRIALSVISFGPDADVWRLLDFFTVHARSALKVIMNLRGLGNIAVNPSHGTDCALPDIKNPDCVFMGDALLHIRMGDTTLLYNVSHATSLDRILHGHINGYSLINVVQLWLSEVHWPEDDTPSLHLPNLHTLCVVLISCTYQREEFPRHMRQRDMQGFFVFHSHQPSLDCPALAEVRISGSSGGAPCLGQPLLASPWDDSEPETPFHCACRNGCILSVTDISDVIRHRIRYTASRLRVLTLSGVRDFIEPAGPTRDNALLQLQRTCADEVIVEHAVPETILDMQAVSRRQHADLRPTRLFDPRSSGPLGMDVDEGGERSDFYLP
ncbi:hypothetical protein EXIGLDRAFT_774034 [Exidia glandulosa HHB12029]|uniref:F-box domain-containing protein n=1 Tax=Exidia glandulosa HHB12029 TaxID=1314781 RepID=A0A165EJ44_EXIGL|nr:hypothetical protein EXIGLDRAFT_774034 [Exidia glandulosa HHB12029]